MFQKVTNVFWNLTNDRENFLSFFFIFYKYWSISIPFCLQISEMIPFFVCVWSIWKKKIQKDTQSVHFCLYKNFCKESVYNLFIFDKKKCTFGLDSVSYGSEETCRSFTRCANPCPLSIQKWALTRPYCDLAIYRLLTCRDLFRQTGALFKLVS
jgi:hypothetical protein